MVPETRTNVLEVYVNYVRRKLTVAADVQPGGAVIETVRGIGYRMARRRPLETVAHPPRSMFEHPISLHTPI
jgi:hypothetical protein